MITRKWAKGNVITTFDRFDGQEYIWVNGKVYHCGWFTYWTYRQISNLIKSGRVYEVVKAEYPAGIIEKDGKFICSICAEPVLPESKCCPHCGTRLNVNYDTCMIDKSKLLKQIADYCTATNEIGAQYIKSDELDEKQSGIILGSLDLIYKLILDVHSGALDYDGEIL